MHETHPVTEHLILHAGGALPAARQHAVDTHLHRCAACRSRAADIAATLDAAAGAYADDRPAPREARARLERRLDELSGTWARSWPTRLRRAAAAARPWAMASAAALVALTAWTSSQQATHDLASLGAGTGAHPLPVAVMTPGAVSGLSAAELCAGARPSRRVSLETRRRVLRGYQMTAVPGDEYELDALITPELGGSVAAENLWPQRYASPVWNARVKDELELLLPRLVCSGDVELAQAQRDIAADWIAAYKRYFNTSAPLAAHAGPAPADDDALEFEAGPDDRSRRFTSSSLMAWVASPASF